jgi:hypothetical protein
MPKSSQAIAVIRGVSGNVKAAIAARSATRYNGPVLKRAACVIASAVNAGIAGPRWMKTMLDDTMNLDVSKLSLGHNPIV